QRAMFRDDQDRTRFLERLRSASEIFSVRVHAYILMSNHLHLIAETAKATRQLKHAAQVRLSARDEELHIPSCAFGRRHPLAINCDYQKCVQLLGGWCTSATLRSGGQNACKKPKSKRSTGKTFIRQRPTPGGQGGDFLVFEDSRPHQRRPRSSGRHRAGRSGRGTGKDLSADSGAKP